MSKFYPSLFLFFNSKKIKANFPIPKKVVLFLCSILLFFTSCNSDEHLIKKFLGRFNAGEINASSEYVWPEDYHKLYVFHNRFIKGNDLMSIDYVDGTVHKEGNKKFVRARLKCNNCDSATIKYFSQNGKFDGESIVDTFWIKSAHDKEYVSLNWDWDESFFTRHVKLCKDTSGSIKLRPEPNPDLPAKMLIEKNKEILIDEGFTNPSWRKAIIFQGKGIADIFYFQSKSSNIKSDIDFFKIGWFAGLSILVLALVAIICFVVVFPLLLAGLFRAGGGGGANALLFLFVLIIVVIAVGYQFLENFLFEAFLINLPL